MICPVSLGERAIVDWQLSEPTSVFPQPHKKFTFQRPPMMHFVAPLKQRLPTGLLDQ